MLKELENWHKKFKIAQKLGNSCIFGSLRLIFRITAMNERYRGGQDIVVELPEDYDVHHIDWLSVYCYKFRVDFGHVLISNITGRIPPFVPSPKRFDDDLPKIEPWHVVSLLGTLNRLNFTFQLGPAGGRRGYQVRIKFLVFSGKNRKNLNFWKISKN